MWPWQPSRGSARKPAKARDGAPSNSKLTCSCSPLRCAGGIAGALGAVIFRALIQLVQTFAFSPEPLLVPVVSVLRGAFGVEDPNLLAPGMDLAWWRRLVAPAIGGLLVGPIVHLLAREAKGHGVPSVMEAVAVRGGMIRPRVAW